MKYSPCQGQIIEQLHDNFIKQYDNLIITGLFSQTDEE